jgi:hypothetical protein
VIVLGNIFIKETKKFYNYISTTHCKDFINEYKEYKWRNLDLFSDDILFNSKKKQKQSLINLYSVLRNNEFVIIKRYIFKDSSEENKFNDWVNLLKDFIEYINNFIDPALLNVDKNIEVDVSKDFNKLTFQNDDFIFYIQFEKTKLKKNNSSLFDTITGLDKDNVFYFIRIKITNNTSYKKYEYKYMEDSSLISENDLDDDICDIQLETIKTVLDKYIYNYIGIVFDNIINRELNLTVDTFNVFNSYYNRNRYKELEDQWLENMNMELN